MPEDTNTPPLPLQEHLGHLIRKLNQKSIAHFMEQSTSTNLTPPQYAVLVALKEHGKSTQRALGKIIAMEASNLHGMLNRMQETGLIKKITDPDNARKSVISLSNEGLELLNNLAPKIRETNLEILENLNPNERQQFIMNLKQILQED